MDKQQASKELAALVEAFEKALSAAEAFADEHKLGFNIDPAYGMGGYYNGGEETYCDDGWNPSSQSC